jgi:riboflavin biosynthesis pyrimidine reductase
MRRVLPEPADDVTVERAYGAPLGSRTDTPWVGLCTVASIDGPTVVEGTSAKLSSPTDSAVLAQLRRLADVIVVGAGTAREEGYGEPSKRGQRVGVVTQTGQLDYTSELFTSGAGFIITSTTGAPDVPDGIDVVRAGADHLDLAAALVLVCDLVGGADFVQVEGGAGLNGAFFQADLIDEINVTTSPATVGGAGPGLATGATAHRHRFDVAQLTIDEESFVYTRWLRRRD